MLNLIDEMNHYDAISKSRNESNSSQHYFDHEPGAENSIYEAGVNQLNIKSIRKELSTSKSKIDVDEICFSNQVKKESRAVENI